MSIEIRKNKELEAQQLFDKTQKVKKYATGANIFLFGMAKELSEIKKDKLYKCWDSEEEVTWAFYVANSEVPISVDVADKWIRIYEGYIEKLGYKKEQLVDIDYSKLLLLLPAVSQDSQHCEELLLKARELSYSDLQQEVKGECLHEDLQEEHIWRCKNCNKIIKRVIKNG